MKRFFIIFIVVFLAAAAIAATEPGKDNGRPAYDEEVQATPETGSESREEQIRDGSWPRPFVPTDKISADSVVSFPGDI